MPNVSALSIAALLAAVAGPAQARDITIMAGNLPPHVNQDGTGREASLIREVMGACGHTVTFKVEPYTRHWESFRKGDGDAVATVPAGLDMPGAASEPYVSYQNGASVLAGSGRAVKTLADLTGKKAVTFAGGKELLPGLKDMGGKMAELREQADQGIHSNLLFANRTDAVLGDGLIFAEYNKRLGEQAKSGKSLPFDPAQPVTFTAIFPPTPFVMVFRDQGLRDAFNACLAQVRQTGKLDAINRAAVEPYRATVGDQYLGY